jgi:hypothetical protein
MQWKEGRRSGTIRNNTAMADTAAAMRQQLVAYIQSLQRKGASRAQIEEALAASGWQKADVDGAFMQLQYLDGGGSEEFPKKERAGHGVMWAIIALVIAALAVYAAFRFRLLEPLLQRTESAIVRSDAAALPVRKENGGEIMRQANDAKRMQELRTMATAIGLYLADDELQPLCESEKTLYASAAIPPPPGWTLGGVRGSKKINGEGWLPIDFERISTGVPVRELPIDPVNDPLQHLVYLYACDPATQTFEINARLDSLKYGSGGLEDQAAKDGGDDPAVFEVGTASGFRLIPKNVLNYATQ